jgi:hypothetical protein
MGKVRSVPIREIRGQNSGSLSAEIMMSGSCPVTFPDGAVGSIAGFAGTAAGIGAVIFTRSTGGVVDHFSYPPILVTAGLLGPLATTVIFVLIGRMRTLDPA